VTVKAIYNDFIWLEELIEIVEKAASCEIYPLLKRPDEKYVTEKAFDNPAFVEDIVRDITMVLREDQRINWYSVESENIESIHNHNAYAYVSSKQ
jgi:GTP cyclohydrolase I